MSQDHEQPYAVRVWKAYRELAERYRTPDVPIHAIHGRVGGSIHELHAFLRAESLAHRAVATTGEPTLAGDAARQSALTLPGEKDTFLNIKLIEPPPMTHQQPNQAESPVEEYERLLRRISELRYPERTPELQTRIERTVARKVQEFTQERQAKRYEASLRRQLAERHPKLTPEQARHYEQRIARLVEEYRQDQVQRHQQQAQMPAPARTQEQGRGIDR